MAKNYFRALALGLLGAAAVIVASVGIVEVLR